MTHKQTLRAIVALIVFFGAAGFSTNAQDWKSEKRVNILFGLNQPVFLSGFNIEGNYISKRWIFDYSHGVSLDFKGNSVTSSLRRQRMAVHMPWTTGVGIGYRLMEWLNVRVEPKWHRFEFYYEQEQQIKSNQIQAYNTFSLGLGLYGSYRPFKKKENFLKGFMISPSIRYWPTVHSTLKDDKFAYFNKHTAKNEEIGTLDPGLGFSPWVINVSVGYSFKL